MKEQPTRQTTNSSDRKKKTRKEKLRENFYAAEKKLNSAADKSAVVYRRIENESAKLNTNATRFSQAAEPFKVTAAFDLDVTNDAKEYGRKAGLIHTGLDLFDISKGTTHKDGLDEAFGLGPSRKAKKGVRNDPLFDMYMGPSKGKRKDEVRWF